MNQEIKNISCTNIVSKLINKTLIDNGFWGYVYKLKLNDALKIAIKIQPLYNDKLYDPSIIDTRDIKLEIKIFKKLTSFCNKYNIFHFPLFYKSLICNNYQLIICKYYNYSLKKLLKNNLSFPHFKNIIHQIIISILLFQKNTHCFHNDITIDNILLLHNNNPIISYNLKYLNLSIPSFNYYVILTDFGNCIRYNKNNKNIDNIDIMQLKLILFNYLYKFIKIFSFEILCNFCINLDNLKFYDFFYTEFKIQFKQLDINDPDLKKETIQKQLKFSIFKYMYNSKYIFKFGDLYNMKKYINIDQSMLDYLDNLPDDIDKCIQYISNHE